MSAVPAWKQAILDKKKKAEEEKKKKEEEEAAYIASLPPWKRALVNKQREQQSPASSSQGKDTKEWAQPIPKVSSSTVSSTAADPGSKWMAALQKSRDSPTLNRRPTWGGSTASATTNQESKAPPSIATMSEPRTGSMNFGAALSSFSNKKSSTDSSSFKSMSILGSITRSVKSTEDTQPSKTTSASFDSASRSQDKGPASPIDTQKPNSVSEIGGTRVHLRSKPSEPATQVSDKRKSFEKDDEDAKFAAMPAWKKAIILRRKAMAQQNKQSQPSPTVPAAQPNQEPKRSQPSSAVPAAQKTRQSASMNEEPVGGISKQVKQEEETPRITPQLEPVEEVDLPFTLRSHKGSYNVTPPKTLADKNSYAGSKPKETTKSTSATSSNTRTKVSNDKSFMTSTSKDSNKESNVPPAKKPTKKQTKTSEGNQNLQVQKTEPKVPASKSPSAKPITNKKNQSQGKTGAKRQPEIVNRPRGEGEGPTKLIEQEGTVHRPPVYKEVDEWANVAENDPSFKKLPLWKQALIKRRRIDIAKRSAAPEPPPDKQQKGLSTKQNTPSWTVHPLNKPAASDRLTTNTQSSTSQESRKLQPVRKAPARPTPSSTFAPAPAKKEEPMFTYSFSKNHRTLDAGSESEDSDSDLEDITVTNLDDSEDEDSGIDKGGIVVTGYKVTNTEFSPTVSPSTTTDVIKGDIPKTDSKSILVNPAKKSYKKLRRVSFSDSSLTEEHFYPKYSYHDYDQVNEEDEDNQNSLNSPNSNNSGLSQRLHPSLRPANETDSDMYRYSPSKSGGLGGYTPSAISSYSYSDMLQNLNSLSQSSKKSPPPPKEVEPEPEPEPEYTSPVNDAANDFYSHLSVDTGALLW